MPLQGGAKSRFALVEFSKRPNSRLPNPRRIGFSNGSSAPHPSVAKLNPHSYAVIPERRPVTEQVSGVIERVTFDTDDRQSCIVREKT